MNSADLLADGFGRIRENVAGVLDDLAADQLSYQPDDGTNSIAWLVWHLTRVQDDHVAKAFDVPQVWTVDGWAKRFGLPADAMDVGFGHSDDQVALFGTALASTGLLAEYHESVYTQTMSLVSKVTDAELDKIVDRQYTPPVTLGVRLVSVMDDDMQHVGQAAYVRGLVERAGI